MKGTGWQAEGLFDFPKSIKFICLDRGFKGNDQLKANAAQTSAARNQGRDKARQIVFRTF